MLGIDLSGLQELLERITTALENISQDLESIRATLEEEHTWQREDREGVEGRGRELNESLETR